MNDLRDFDLNTVEAVVMERSWAFVIVRVGANQMWRLVEGQLVKLHTGSRGRVV